MFNAAYTIHSQSDIVAKSIESMLKEKAYPLQGIGKDELDTVHLKAVNKSIFSVLKYQLKSSRKFDPEAQRAAIHFSIAPDNEENSYVFLSIFPLMEFYHLPEIPGISESEEERQTDLKLCDSILTEITQAIHELFPNAEENFLTRPMKRVYHLPDSRTSFSRDEVVKKIIEILKLQKFETIKTNESEYNLAIEIIAVNKSFSHTALERIKNIKFSQFLKSTQRMTIRCTIFKPKLGHNHKLEILVEMYPSMEILGREEIQMLTQSLDEEMADSRLGKDLWEPFISELGKEFGDYVE